LVNPIAAIDAAAMPALAIASRPVSTTLAQIASGSCSTQPGAG
jgi:hypothetical protein